MTLLNTRTPIQKIFLRGHHKTEVAYKVEIGKGLGQIRLNQIRLGQIRLSQTIRSGQVRLGDT